MTGGKRAVIEYIFGLFFGFSQFLPRMEKHSNKSPEQTCEKKSGKNSKKSLKLVIPKVTHRVSGVIEEL